MGETTAISWTDHTFNPWIGCTKVSAGCKNCYAERENNFRKWNGGTWGVGAPRKLTSDANWRKPLQWDKAARAEGVRRRVFCASLADVFDEEVPDEWRDRLMTLIESTTNLDWLLLTKRPANAKRYLGPFGGAVAERIWIGTTVENQAAADERIPILLQIPAAVRFLSCEPLLGPVDLTRVDYAWQLRDLIEDAARKLGYPEPGPDDYLPGSATLDPLGGTWDDGEECGTDLPRIHWVIAGSESGPGARTAEIRWFDSLREQCAAAGVAFHQKQITRNGRPIPMNEWPEHLRVQEFPAIDAAAKELGVE